MERRRIVIIFILFISVFLNRIPSPAFVRVAGEEVLPPDILPVVILKGSDYEMGFQYGQQAGHLIEKTRDGAWAEALQRFSREEVIHALKANQHYIKKYTPQWIEFMRGMADGATAAGHQVSYIDVVLMNCTLPKPATSTYPAGAEKDKLFGVFGLGQRDQGRPADRDGYPRLG